MHFRSKAASAHNAALLAAYHAVRECDPIGLTPSEPWVFRDLRIRSRLSIGGEVRCLFSFY
jgi:hypothetical protein